MTSVVFACDRDCVENRIGSAERSTVLRWNAARRGFTPVELLVVISFIGVLIDFAGLEFLHTYQVIDGE